MPGHSWRISNIISDQTVNTGSNDTQVGSTVHFITGDGWEGSVFIPDNKWNHEHIKTAVRQRAKQLDEVGKLSEGIG